MTYGTGLLFANKEPPQTIAKNVGLVLLKCIAWPTMVALYKELLIAHFCFKVKNEVNFNALSAYNTKSSFRLGIFETWRRNLEFLHIWAERIFNKDPKQGPQCDKFLLLRWHWRVLKRKMQISKCLPWYQSPAEVHSVTLPGFRLTYCQNVESYVVWKFGLGLSSWLI